MAQLCQEAPSVLGTAKYLLDTSVQNFHGDRFLEKEIDSRGISRIGILFPVSIRRAPQGYSDVFARGGAFPAALWLRIMSCRHSMPNVVKAGTPSSPRP